MSTLADVRRAVLDCGVSETEADHYANSLIAIYSADEVEIPQTVQTHEPQRDDRDELLDIVREQAATVKELTRAVMELAKRPAPIIRVEAPVTVNPPSITINPTITAPAMPDVRIAPPAINIHPVIHVPSPGGRVTKIIRDEAGEMKELHETHTE